METRNGPGASAALGKMRGDPGSFSGIQPTRGIRDEFFVGNRVLDQCST
jgi:hypothetical protein